MSTMNGRTGLSHLEKGLTDQCRAPVTFHIAVKHCQFRVVIEVTSLLSARRIVLRSPTPVWYRSGGAGWNQKRPTRTTTTIAPRAIAIAGLIPVPGPGGSGHETGARGLFDARAQQIPLARCVGILSGNPGDVAGECLID